MLLKNRLTFIFHEIDDEAAVYTVFEVLNSRGLEVAWLDRTKSTLIAIAFEYAQNAKIKDEVIHELHCLWSEIYSTIGLRQGLGSETLRFAATLINPELTSKVLGDEQALEVISERCGSKVRKTIELTKWLLEVAKAVDGLEADTRRAARDKDRACATARGVDRACAVRLQGEGTIGRTVGEGDIPNFRHCS
jgi:hypothetical protein